MRLNTEFQGLGSRLVLGVLTPNTLAFVNVIVKLDHIRVKDLV